MDEKKDNRFEVKVITGLEPCDEKCVDWPKDPNDKNKHCYYCVPESLFANQKRTKNKCKFCPEITNCVNCDYFDIAETDTDYKVVCLKYEEKSDGRTKDSNIC